MSHSMAAHPPAPSGICGFAVASFLFALIPILIGVLLLIVGLMFAVRSF